jgi:uncharacterized protein (TIGR02391 family)
LQDTIALAGLWEGVGPDETGGDFLRAIHEAWWWLRNHGLVVPRVGDGGPGWCEVTTRARRVLASDDGLALIHAEARLDVELHPLVAGRIRRQFILGEYELAVFAAMKTVEVRIRELSGLGADVYGVGVARRAFNPADDALGPLADPTLQLAEREAVAHLYAGALGFFKNPTTHRNVDYSDPVFASEVILFADLLLRMAERRDDRSQTDTLPASEA